MIVILGGIQYYKMNKKAQVYSLGIVALTLVVLLMAFSYYYANISTNIPLGTHQSEILLTYQNSRVDLINIDTKAKDSAINSLYDLASHSGFSKEGKCGNYKNIPLLSYKNELNDYVKCVPNIEEEYEKEFKEQFQKISSEKDKNNYEYFAKKFNNKFQISGFALKNKEIQIGKAENKRILSYKPSFTDKTKYNFTIYDKIIPNFMKQLNDNCKDKENNKVNENELDDCVNEQLKSFNEDSKIKISLYNEKNKTYQLSQNLKDIDNTNFKDCFKQVSNPFLTSGIIQPEDRFYFETKNPSSLIINQDNIFDINLNHDFYFYDETKKNPFDIRDKIYSFDISAGFLQNKKDASETYEMQGISLYEHNGNFFYVPKNSLWGKSGDDWSQYNQFESRTCEYENRMYSFIIDDSELYPEKGNLEYKFSVYIKDIVVPEIETLSVEDKEFDEDTSLVKWKHSDSNDITKYEIYLNDNLIKTIVPWSDVNTYTQMNWEYGKEQPFNSFNSCQLEKDKNGFTQCYYSFNNRKGLLEDNQTYYFKEDQEFVYVLKFKEGQQDLFNKLKIISYDDDGNFASKDTFVLYPKDTLPYEPIKDYIITPGLESVEDTLYGSVNYVGVESPLEIPSLINNIISEVPINTEFIKNIDGSISNKLPESRRLYHQVGVMPFINDKTLSTEFDGVTIQLGMSYSTTIPAYFLPVYEDPSLENIQNINLDLFGYKAQSIPLSKDVE